jgi:hypothetical protein
MSRVEHCELTEQRTHSAAISNVFHCNPPRLISTGYSTSCVRVIIIMRKNHFGCARRLRLPVKLRRPPGLMGRLAKPDPLKVVVYLFNASRYRSFAPREYGWPDNLRAIRYLWVDDPAP